MPQRQRSYPRSMLKNEQDFILEAGAALDHVLKAADERRAAAEAARKARDLAIDRHVLVRALPEQIKATT